ncbi:MAG: molybdopterin cofactor-binding domain-containing protein [Paracoccaceae bacterium]
MAPRWSNFRSTPPWAIVRPHRITAASDLGRVINPRLAMGQIEGGIAQAWAWR